MAVAYSTSSASGTADAGSTTQDSSSTVVPSSAISYVLVANSDGSPATPSGVAWDPTGVNQALTQVGTTISHGTFARASLWRGISLTAGTAVFRATWGANQGERMVCPYVVTGADTTTPNGTITQNSGTGTGITTGSMSVNSGDWVAALGAFLYTSGSPTGTFDSPTGNERAEGVTSGTSYDGAAIQDITAAGSSQALAWTIGSITPDSWAIFGFAINVAGAGAGTDPIPTAIHPGWIARRPRGFGPGTAR